MAVKGNKSQVGRCNVTQFTGAHVLSLDPDTDLHGRAVGHVQAALEGQQVTNVDRAVKVNSFNRGSDHIGAGIAAGNDKGGVVNELHDNPAVDIAGRVGVVGHHDMGNYGSTELGSITVVHKDLLEIKGPT